MVRRSLKNGSTITFSAHRQRGALPRLHRAPVRGFVGPGELPEPSGHGKRVGGIGESRGRQAPEAAKESGARRCEAAEHPDGAEPPAGANRLRVERVELRRRVVPDDAIASVPGDQRQAPRALGFPRRDVDEDVADGPGALRPRPAEDVPGKPAHQRQGLGPRAPHLTDGAAAPGGERGRAQPRRASRSHPGAIVRRAGAVDQPHSGRLGLASWSGRSCLACGTVLRCGPAAGPRGDSIDRPEKGRLCTLETIPTRTRR
jgi:hypothetical protein